MDQEMLSLYEAFENYTTDNLFWSLLFLNNANFQTPLKTDAQKKLLSMSQSFQNIMGSLYPPEQTRELTASLSSSNQWFISYVDSLLQDSSETSIIKSRWQENGRQTAALLSQLNPYWKPLEWSAMINYESDLLETLALKLKEQNYGAFINTVPICRRLAIDMSKYMCSGVAQQKKGSWQSK